jgi:O-antigen/teichoic acid export membrane protein
MVVIGSFAMVMVTGRIGAAMLSHYYDYLGDTIMIRRYLRSLFSASVYIGAGVLLCAAMIGAPLFDIIFKSDEILFFPYGITIIAYAVISEINLNYFIFLKNEKKLARFALVTLTQMLLLIVFQYVLIVVMREGVQGALLGMLAANVITTILILIMERDIFTLRPDWNMVKSSLIFSLPLIPYLIIYWFMTKGERIVLEQMASLEVVGKYVLLVTLTGLVVILIEAVINGVRPFLFELFKDSRSSNDAGIDLLCKMIVNVPLLALPVIILVGTNIQLLTSNTDYHAIAPYVSLGAITAYCIVFGKLFYQQLIFAKKSVQITLLSFVSLTIFIISLYYFIPRFEIWGVLYAVLIVNFAFASLFFWFAQMTLPVKYSFSALIFNPLVCVAAILLLQKVMLNAGYTLAMYGLVQFFVILLLIVLLNWASIKDYKQIFIKA